MKDLDTHFEKIVPIKLSAEKLKIKPIFLVIILIVLAFFLSFNSYIGNIVVLVTGIFYPALMSFSAIHSKELDDDKQWLTYWVIFGALNIFDNLGNFIPLYYTFKLCILVYLFFPSTRGSLKLYEKFQT